ncbi:hypothetical protein D9758_012163 [Tetrapyrgos nigripes]|uniref:FAD linked oxidase N-terminal domain-containing protein n=1 Tax=Tetrapyrgos nigripes TaxID=182062 RepID=A0A8H5CGZ3_9AGAR|nr:hypothetical protein D9758_012163 [Tetrapyrgos nigripes]
MHFLLFPVFTVALCRASQSQTPLGVVGDNTPGHLCCTVLSKSLPELALHLPGSLEYDRQQETYYLRQQTDLLPFCRVSPATPSEVALTIKTLTKHACHFSVRSGGHMGCVGSNTDGGVVLDLGRLDGIDVDKRGISLLSFQHGFGSDNVVNYQVVLADGSIVDANATFHPDLFWALKLGGTNFGIVTRFDVLTYPLKDVWSGIRTYPITAHETPQLLDNWISFTQDSASVKEELQAICLGRHNTHERAIVWHASLDTSPSAPLTLAASIIDTTKTTTLLDAIHDLQFNFADHKRVRWFTFTTRLDASFLWDVFSRAKEIYDELEHVSGIHWDVLIQPITRGFSAASSETGENPFRNVLMESGDDLALVLLSAYWDHRADDEAMYDGMRKLGSWSEDTARQRGILNDFIYLNYANEEQPVYARSVNRDDLARMRKVKQTYDSEDVLGRLWKGGFKLPHDSSDEHWGFESAARTEL